MPWIVLVVSGVLEAVWATALGRSEGLTRPVEVVVFAVALLISMVGLSRAARTIPIGTAYSVWVGIGAVLTVVFALATGAEPFSWPKVFCIGGVVIAVIGLKLVPSDAAVAEDAESSPRA
ncbi:DMT family transporter [Pseudoclavibacter sp. 13-3]|uniref:DMT family transporter n=1 Tax=Pseudoclavibacter sp. 13-3 TaxID=2901228 RepID=UPI001E4A92F0|nr:multidrug efflux SMR transporter [Pseudoclavibacter sp. 13-3]MCD7101627.1 multidrug efflux SMR transporter [Pseudoclavibacter sp. 13-3]